MSVSPCQAKVFYDTEFEATLAAARAEYDFKSEMTVYKCGTHWHIANKNKKMRSKSRPFNRSYCKSCDCYMRPGRYENHITKPGHLAKLKKSLN